MEEKELANCPEAEISEIIPNLKKSSIGRFYKEYRKGKFMYFVEKRPFREMVITAVHSSTKKVFFYSKMWQEWKDLGKKFDEF